jgi:PAS domain S-box-containing protein
MEQFEFSNLHQSKGQQDLPILDKVINYLSRNVSYDTIIIDELAEQKIREQAVLLDVVTDAIFIRGLDNRIIYWNKAAERLYGWTGEEAREKKVSEILYKDNKTEQQTAFLRVIEAGEWRGELNKITKNNKNITVESHWTLLRDKTGQPQFILTVDADMTEKKQLEAQFLRTQRLENLGILAGGIAHDLNNILTPIMTIAQLLPLTLTNIDERNQRMLRILETNTKRGADLVKQILSFARGNEEKCSLIQIAHLLLDVEQIIKGTFPKSIEIKTDVKDDLWVVSADATQLHQVFMNLVVNARDAMPHGGILTITAENQLIDENYTKMNTQAKVGSYILVTFADTGVGISKDIINKIFDPFFTTKEVDKGTGLGLSTVLGIIKNNRGFVEVYSELHKGSIFKIYLPATHQTASIVKDNVSIAEGNGEVILFVDDEVAISEVSKNTLENHGYRVLIANDGIEAIATYAQNKLAIKVVVMDLMMPSLDGVTAIQALKKMNPDVQIIAMSGSNFSEEKTQAQNLGVREFLPKPFTTNDLLNILHMLLH